MRKFTPLHPNMLKGYAFGGVTGFIIKLLSTFFYVGYLPFIPGTFGSLGGIALYYLVKDNPLMYVLLTLGVTIAGFLVSGKAENIFNRKDPRYVVIDEVSGMLLAMASLMFVPYDLKFVVMAFFVFRFFDALKPYPASALEKLKGGYGIMCDDLLAALYTNIVLQIVLRLLTVRGS